MESFPGNDKHLAGGTIIFANKNNLDAYNVKSTIVVRRQMEFLGMGLKAVLQFPPHVDGFHFINADKGPDAVDSKLTNLKILGSGSLFSNGTGTGVKASVTIHIHNCAILQWYDYCVHFFTDAAGQGPDGWRISDCAIGACSGTGFYVYGHNSQVGTMMNCFVTRCMSGKAIHDESFLGNTYVAVMCSYGGILTTGDAKNGGNTCTFVGCYVESGNPCYIAYPSVVVGGELSSIGNQDIPLGSALFFDGYNISNGFRYFAAERTGAYFDGKHTVKDPPKVTRTAHIIFGAPPLSRDAHGLMSFGEEQGNTGWGFRWVRPGQFGWNYAGASIGFYGLNFYTKNAQPANGFSRDLSNDGLGGIGFDVGFFLGPGPQKFTSSDALPRRGSHAVGDICFNYKFKPGGVSHWRCVASGAPGEWEPVFELLGKAYTVATLPKAGPSLQGARAHVTDAKAPSFLAPLVGGGATVCPAFCNGAEWVAG